MIKKVVANVVRLGEPLEPSNSSGENARCIPAVGSSLTVAYEDKDLLCHVTQQFHSQAFCKKSGDICGYKTMHVSVHSNRAALNWLQPNAVQLMNKQSWVYPFSGLLLRTKHRY